MASLDSIRRYGMRGLVIAAFTLMVALVLGVLSLYAKEVPHHDMAVETNDPKICLECHEGVIDADKYYCTANAHPVFINYPPEGRTAYFAQSAEVEAAGIKLPAGQIACVSCHNLEYQHQYHLSVERSQSRLCLTCHSQMGR